MRNYDETYLDPEQYELGRPQFDQEILNYTSFSMNRTVMEVGCGNGRFLKKLVEKYPDLTITGLDVSQKGIDVCRKKLTGRFICADILEYGGTEKYDYVMCFNTIEHFAYPRAVMVRMKQLSKPKGIIYLTVPNAETDTCEEHLNFWNVESFDCFVSEFFTVEKCRLIDQNQNILIKAWNT